MESKKYRVIRREDGDTYYAAPGTIIESHKQDRDGVFYMDGEEKYLWNHEVEPAEDFGNTQPDTKDTNPKDSAATNRLPLDLVPSTLEAMVALAFAEGAAKYGAYNWRVAGVRSSVYRAAMKRHFDKWWNGEDADPKTGVPHLASLAAGAAIIMDAALAGKLTDDRPPKVPLGELIDPLEPKVAAIRGMFKDKHPHHHTALDQA